MRATWIGVFNPLRYPHDEGVGSRRGALVVDDVVRGAFHLFIFRPQTASGIVYG